MKEEYDVDVLVIGAGVVGLAIARKLARSGNDVWLLERECDAGMQTSSRNSEVIHAGIYYPQGSLKAELCVAGKEQLYRYCAEHHIPHQRCGKIIVAVNEDQKHQLKAIQKKAQLNGVCDLAWLDQKALHEVEPHLQGLAALFSPSTGIVDSHRYMMQLLADFEQAGGQLVLKSELCAKQFSSHHFAFEIVGQNAQINARHCVNAGGLQAIELISGVKGFPESCVPEAFFAKGSYFSYGGSVPFKHLIYPVPEPGGLGIHLTLDQTGAARFGPDVEWLDDEADFDYRVSPLKREEFYRAIKTYWPDINRDKLIPDYSGVRPKLTGPGESAGDFMIQGAADHGLSGLVNLFGIESPGLTASLALADYVANQLQS